jgi:hypothetical protein
MLSSFVALAEAGVARAHNLLSRAWYILSTTGLATHILPWEKGRGSLACLMVVERREEADDHIGAIYGVYIHRYSITVTAV